jgi:hypothetical protein
MVNRMFDNRIRFFRWSDILTHGQTHRRTYRMETLTETSAGKPVLQRNTLNALSGRQAPFVNRLAS